VFNEVPIGHRQRKPGGTKNNKYPNRIRAKQWYLASIESAVLGWVSAVELSAKKTFRPGQFVRTFYNSKDRAICHINSNLLIFKVFFRYEITEDSLKPEKCPEIRTSEQAKYHNMLTIL
jgi:hypothetical protein